MTFNLANLQRVAVSAFGALLLATVFVGTAVAPSETAVVVAPVA